MMPLTADDYAWAVQCARERIYELRRTIDLLDGYLSNDARSRYSGWITELQARKARFLDAMKVVMSAPTDEGEQP